MIDITSISAVVAASGVIVGVVFAYLEVRSLARTRRTELFHGVFTNITRREFLESWEKVNERESASYEDYKKKYGFVEYNQVFTTFTEIGILVSQKLIDVDSVYKIFGLGVKKAWEKLKPLIEEFKETEPQEVWAFEYLYNEMKKREQQLATFQ